MKRILGVMILAACVIALTAPMAAAQSKLEGVWKLAEYTISGKEGSTSNKQPQPGFLIFTKRHYSTTYVISNTARSVLPQNASDSQKVAAWQPFQATAGTYEIRGNSVVLRTLAAKSPLRNESASQEWKFQLQGENLICTGPPLSNGTIFTFKMVRVE